MDAWVWILLIVVVVAIVVAALASRSRQRENRRVEAAELRDPAADHHLERREKEAAAAGAEAEARRVRAEADQRAAEAQQLQVQAQRASTDRDSAVAASEAEMRRADALDPDVRTDKEGYRLDEDGNRVETAAEERAGAGFGTAAAAGAGGMAAGAGAGALGDTATRDDERDLEARDRAGAAEEPSTANVPEGHDETITDDASEGAVDRDAKVGRWDQWEGRDGEESGRRDDPSTATGVRDDTVRDDTLDDGRWSERTDRDGTETVTEESAQTERGLDDEAGVGRGGDARDEHSVREDGVGRVRDLDDDQTGIDEREPEPGDAAVGEMDARDRARDRADDVLTRRDADTGRQPE
jgi:hypothetical protein